MNNIEEKQFLFELNNSKISLLILIEFDLDWIYIDWIWAFEWKKDLKKFF